MDQERTTENESKETVKNSLKIRRNSGKKLSLFQVTFFVGCVAVVVILILGIAKQKIAYQSFQVVSSIEKTDNTSVYYQILGNGLLRYSKDGASYMESLDETLWNQTFEMESARAVACDEYVAIGDIGSNQIRIFDEDGQVGSISTSYPIEDLAIADQGVVAVILSDDTSNYIYLYSVSGEELVVIKASVSQMGYPLDLAISEDGQKLAVSYLNFASGSLSTTIVFYHFGDAGSDAENHIMGSFDSDEIIPKIEFLDNRTIAAYGEEGFTLFSMEETPQLTAEVDFGQEIKSLFVSEQYLGFVFKNDTDSSEDEDDGDEDSIDENSETENSEESEDGQTGRYHMEIYTSSGKLYMEKDFDFAYDTITNTSQEIILYNESECLILSFSGQEIFSYTFEDTVMKLLPKNTSGSYILVTDTSVQEIKLSRLK